MYMKRYSSYICIYVYVYVYVYVHMWKHYIKVKIKYIMDHIYIHIYLDTHEHISLAMPKDTSQKYVKTQSKNLPHTTWKCISEAAPQLALDPSDLENIVPWGLCWTTQHCLLWTWKSRREGCTTGIFATESFHHMAIKFLGRQWELANIWVR